MDVKIFTIEEANKLIPRIERQLKSLMKITQKAVKNKDQLEVLELIGGTKKENPHHEEFLANKVALNTVVDEFNDLVKKIQSTGCLVKDLHHGLIDFYAYHKERLIFLCWTVGEKRVEYWHEIHSGFAGRRHISELTSKL